MTCGTPWTGCTTTISISITRWTTWQTRVTPGISTSTRVATSDSLPAAVRGRTAARPIECPRFSGTAASLITWTTGARKADTNGPIGITRCGNTSGRITKELFARLARIVHHGKESHRPLRLRVHPLPAPRQTNVRPLLSLRRLPAADGQRVRTQRDHRDPGGQAAPRHADSSAGATRERTARYLPLPHMSDRDLERLRK